MGTSVRARPGSRRTQAERRAETQQALLHSAAACFAEKGYVETRLADVVKRAGRANGALWFYWQSKAELAAAVWEFVETEALQKSVPRSGASRPSVDDLLTLLFAVRDDVNSRAVRAILAATPADGELRVALARLTVAANPNGDLLRRTLVDASERDPQMDGHLKVLALAATTLNLFYAHPEFAEAREQLIRDVEATARVLLEGSQ